MYTTYMYIIPNIHIILHPWLGNNVYNMCVRGLYVDSWQSRSGWFPVQRFLPTREAKEFLLASGHTR